MATHGSQYLFRNVHLETKNTHFSLHLDNLTGLVNFSLKIPRTGLNLPNIDYDIQNIVLVEVRKKKNILGMRYYTNVHDTAGRLHKKYM